MLYEVVEKDHPLNKDPFVLALGEYKNGSVLDKATLQSLLSQSQNDLTKLFVFFFLSQDNLSAFQKEVLHILERHYPLKTLSSFWICYDILHRFNQKLPLDLIKEFDHIFFQHTLLSFVLTSLLHAKTKDNLFLDYANQYHSFCVHWQDHNKKPLLPIWSDEKEYSSFDILSSYLLFIQAKERFSGIIDERKETLLQQLKKTEPTATLPFYLTLEELIAHSHVMQNSYVEEKRNEGVLHHFEQSTFFATPFGVKSSLGMARGNQVEISAFGPQSLPLDDSKNFGIVRPYFLKDQPIIMKKKADGFFLDGWMSLANKKWGRFSLQALGNCLDISFTFFDPEKSGFSFYIKAAYCDLFDKRYLGKHLCHEKKEIKKIYFGDEKEKVKISFNKPVSSEIITLSGKSFFWEANFLLFIHCHKDEKITATLSY